MMSKSDMPAGMYGQNVEHTTTTTTTFITATTVTQTEDPNIYHAWKCIHIDLAFVKSQYGICIAAEILLSLLGWICVSVPQNAGCAYLHSGAYSYFEYTASSCLISSIIWYTLFALAIPKKLGFMRWDIMEVIWCAFYIINYLIASSVVASKTCRQGGYKAAAAFGFLCLFVLTLHAVTEGRKLHGRIKSHRGTSTTYGPGGTQVTTEAY